MIIDCISDMHGYYPKMQGGDLLIVAGDMTPSNKIPEWCDFFAWVKDQPYTKKILVAGNHDGLFQSGFPKSQKEADELREVKKYLNFKEDFEYLCDSGTEFQGVKIWGSPWTTSFSGMNPHCMAFTVDTDEELAEKWKLIPRDTNILVTHCPPYGILDRITTRISLRSSAILHAGSVSLLERIQDLWKLKLHVFGHLHEAYGEHKYYDRPLTYINASHVNDVFDPVNKPVRIFV